MEMFKKLIETLKATPKRIVFTEGTDPRILEASARLLSGTFLTPILIGNEEETGRPPRTTASTSGAPSSSTRRSMRTWRPWWLAWWSCARAR